MQTHNDNSHDNDQNGTLSQLLQRAAVAEQKKVNGTSEFVRKLRARIENEPATEESRIVRLANRADGVEHRRGRVSVATWITAAAIFAAALLVIASNFVTDVSTENRTTQLHRDKYELPANTDDHLPVPDAEKGVRIVNTALSQTFQSVGVVRNSLRDLLAPINAQVPQTTGEASKSEHADHSIQFDDDRFVASFAAKVFGQVD